MAAHHHASEDEGHVGKRGTARGSIARHMHWDEHLGCSSCADASLPKSRFSKSWNFLKLCHLKKRSFHPENSLRVHSCSGSLRLSQKAILEDSPPGEPLCPSGSPSLNLKSRCYTGGGSWEDKMPKAMPKGISCSRCVSTLPWSPRPARRSRKWKTCTMDALRHFHNTVALQYWNIKSQDMAMWEKMTTMESDKQNGASFSCAFTENQIQWIETWKLS